MKNCLSVNLEKYLEALFLATQKNSRETQICLIVLKLVAFVQLVSKYDRQHSFYKEINHNWTKYLNLFNEYS